MKVEDLPKPGFSYLPTGGENLIKRKETASNEKPTNEKPSNEKHSSLRKLTAHSLPSKVKPVNPDEKPSSSPSMMIPTNPLSAKPVPSLLKEKPPNFDKQNRGAIQLGLSSNAKPKNPLYFTQKVNPTPKPNNFQPNISPQNNTPPNNIPPFHPINSNTLKKPLANFVDPKKNPIRKKQKKIIFICSF